MNVIFDVKKDICKNSQSAVWLEVFFVGCMDIEVLAIGLVITWRKSYLDQFGAKGRVGEGASLKEIEGNKLERAKLTMMKLIQKVLYEKKLY